MKKIKIRQIKVPITKDTDNFLQEKIKKLLKVTPVDYKISKKSIDARDTNNIYYIYEVIVKVDDKVNIKSSKDIIEYIEENYTLPPSGDIPLKEKIVIVGCGPAGLFSAYMLSKSGYHPYIIERGKTIDERVEDVKKFWEEGTLNENSNVQFGEGGAGTFSDGKLNTLIKDKRHLGKKVFEIFVECGAPKEIMYIKNPHIGTDILRTVVKNMRKEIEKMGGVFKYNTTLTNIIVEDNHLNGIVINNKEIIKTNNCIIALGNSSRDTIKMLREEGVEMTPKPFAIGLRVMHSQDIINKNQYGKYYNILPPASYKLTYTTKEGRGVYSFCMCPGGFVVNASSEKERLVVNGMSNYKRDEETANSAIVVTTTPADFNESIEGAINFQRALEEKTYKLGNGKIPIQLLKDFKENKKSTKLGNVKPITKGDYVLENIRNILPDYITTSIIEAFDNFAQKIKGFANDDTIIAAIETRTSSPIRILRDENFESNIKGLYPAGEGSGYSGGITSSAIDGIKVAESIIKKYKI